MSIKQLKSPEMLFEDINGEPFARLPWMGNGYIKADGKKILNLSQTAERFGRNGDFWRQRWLAVFGPYFPQAGQAEAPIPSDKVAAKSVASRVGMDAMRTIRFPKLNDAQWEYVKNEAIARKIDLREIWVKLELNEETGHVEPIILTTIRKLRQLADQGGRRAGESEPEFCAKDGSWKPGPWTSDDPPFASRVFVTRGDTGERIAGVAYWDLCAGYIANPDGTKTLSRYWRKGGAGYMLGKCASSTAHRLAFPTEIANFYIIEELNVPVSSTGDSIEDSRKDAPERNDFEPAVFGEQRDPLDLIPDDPRRAVDWVDDTTPSRSGLTLALVYSGHVSSPKEAEVFIERCRIRFRRIHSSGERLFSAVVLRASQCLSAADPVAIG